MSHHTTISTGPAEPTPQKDEQNILGLVMNVGKTRPHVTIGPIEGCRRRKPRVGLKGGRNRHYTWQEKLDARIISKGDGCWEVSGHRLRNGSVQISRVAAHRLAWTLAHGPIPDGLVIAHTCDNPCCVRLDHLVATTQAENIYDSIRKGRYNAFGRQKLNAAQVISIREAVAAGGETQKAIGARFGVGRSCVSGIANHKGWAHLTSFVSGPQPVVDIRAHALELDGHGYEVFGQE